MTTLFALAARLQSAHAPEALLLILAKATLLLAIARLLLVAMPRASAAAKHLVATVALIAVAAMPVMSAIIPAWNLRVAPAPAPQPVAIEESAAETTAISAITIGNVRPFQPLTAVERLVKVARSTWKGALILFAALGTLLLFAQMLIGMLGVWFVARSAEELDDDDALRELDRARDQLALTRDIRLLRSSRISVPVVWGVRRPVLLLPVDVVTWPVERLRVVLLHELAHLKRHDGVSLILTRAAVALFWFHPLAWSLERAGRGECERACDDLVLAGGTKASEYADHLLAIARSMPTFDPFRSVTLAMSRKSQLEGRLLSILQPHAVRRVFSGRGVAVACAFALAIIVPLSALRLIAEPVKQQAKNKEMRTDSTITVTDDVEHIGDYLLTKLGRYSSRLDRYAHNPRDAEEWYDRAYDFYRSDRYEEAADAFRHAAEGGFKRDTSLYNAACSYGLYGDADRAVAMLNDAIAAGWDDFDKIADDSDFDRVRTDPRFVAAFAGRHSDVAVRRVEKTVNRYKELERKVKTKDSGDDWYDVGLDMLSLRRTNDAVTAFQNAIAAGEKPASSMYNIACAYSLGGNARNGMLWLDKAIEAGWSDDDKFHHDPDIALLRKEPDFDRLVEKASDLELHGCCEGKLFRWFDDDDASNWREAEEHHRMLVGKYPDSGRAWFNLGYTALRAHDFAVAHDAWQHAMQLGHRVGTVSYNVACTYALEGNRDAAFAWLDKAKAAGFDVDDHSDDDDLESLHGDARWRF